MVENPNMFLKPQESGYKLGTSVEVGKRKKYSDKRLKRQPAASALVKAETEHYIWQNDSELINRLWLTANKKIIPTLYIR